MSQGHATPLLPANAAKEKGGKLDKIEDTATNTLVNLLSQILVEQKITNHLLSDRRDDLDALRTDYSS